MLPQAAVKPRRQPSSIAQTADVSGNQACLDALTTHTTAQPGDVTEDQGSSGWQYNSRAIVNWQLTTNPLSSLIGCHGVSPWHKRL